MIAVGGTVRDASNVLQFANIARTASMATSLESHRLAGKYLSASYKKYMLCVIMSSRVNVGRVRYSCRYSDVSVISSAFVFLSIS